MLCSTYKVHGGAPELLHRVGCAEEGTTLGWSATPPPQAPPHLVHGLPILIARGDLLQDERVLHLVVLAPCVSAGQDELWC